MTTRDDILAKAYPKHIERIRELAGSKFMRAPPTTCAANELASGFDWHATTEGQEYWMKLYERGADQQSWNKDA